MTLTIPETTVEWIKENEQHYRLNTFLIKAVITFDWKTDKWIGVLKTANKSFTMESTSLEDAFRNFPIILNQVLNTNLNIDITINQIRL